MLVLTNPRISFVNTPLHPEWELFEDTLHLGSDKPAPLAPLHRTLGTREHLDGHWMSPFQLAGKPETRVRSILLFSNRERNSRMRSYNGNRLNLIKLVHWNAGNSKWESKRIELEALVLEKQPDILFISEANLWKDLDDNQRDIPGYTLAFPQSNDGKSQLCQVSALSQRRARN